MHIILYCGNPYELQLETVASSKGVCFVYVDDIFACVNTPT